MVAITALNFNLSRLIGPVIGGFIQSVGAPTLAITAATYVAPVTAIFFMRPRERSAPTSAAGDGYLGELLDGWRPVIMCGRHRLCRHRRAAGRSVRTLPILANGAPGAVGPWLHDSRRRAARPRHPSS